MKINNYDMNSKGINIELSIFYDTWLAQVYFKENFVKYLDGYAFIDWGNINIEEFKRQHDIIKHKSIGYCQGDVVHVYINKTLLKRIWGAKNIDMEVVKKEISHYLWDTPMHFHLEIDNKIENRNVTIEVYDIFDEEYVYYDKNDVLERLKKHLTQKEIDEVINLLPQQVEYL